MLLTHPSLVALTRLHHAPPLSHRLVLLAIPERRIRVWGAGAPIGEVEPATHVPAEDAIFFG